MRVSEILTRVGVTGGVNLDAASETRHGWRYFFFFLAFTAGFLPFTAFFFAAMFTSPPFPLW